MDVDKQLVLIANPGSASRKYALYDGRHERASVHFEWLNNQVIYTLTTAGGGQHQAPAHIRDLQAAAARLTEILRERDILQPGEKVARIGLRIVAPSSYFLEDRVVDGHVIDRLEELKPRAPIHIAATLEELHTLRQHFRRAKVIGVSDSAFHAAKPDYAWNYGIPIEDADRFEIKRFGYHGLSLAAVVRSLRKVDKLPPKIIVCHLGSGASITALHGGKSLDNTMGYSPLDGLVMSTRSGAIDPTAVHALKDVFKLDDHGVEDYLNNHSGLLGLGGSSDVHELLIRETYGDHRSELALATYVYSIQKGVGQMAAALGGCDALVFTGGVGERSAPIRARVTARLHFLDFILDEKANEAAEAPKELTAVSRLAHSKPVYVAPTQEAAEIARRLREFN